MLLSSRFGLRNVSEKTIEVNVLNELASYLWSHHQLTMTAISPTQVEEDTLCFDDILEGLPPGRLFAIQFKRPYQMRRPRDAVKFTVSTRQLSRLASTFFPNEAFLFLTPLPTNDLLVNNRLNLLRVTVALDVHCIPNAQKTSQKTRTIRIHLPLVGPSRMEVSDPRKFEKIEGILTVAKLARSISEIEVGYEIRDQEKYERKERKERIGVRRMYYVHVSTRARNLPSENK
jgi:hypothetical protein